MTAERFCTYLADTTDANSIHHHLRYRVYCQKKHYEEGVLIENLPQERDRYDEFATKFIVKDTFLDLYMGTARLVPNHGDSLPARALGAIDDRHAELLGKERSAEVSRLATISKLRPDHTAQLMRSLIIGALGHSQLHGIEWLVFLISPGMARLLDRLGVPMEACGAMVRHRGIRRAYRSHVPSGIASSPWTRCLRDGSVGFELFSTQYTAAVAA